MEMPDWFQSIDRVMRPAAYGAPIPKPDPNAAMRVAAMSGEASPMAPTGFSSAQTVGPDATGFSNTPLPPPRPQSFPTAMPASPPLPMARPGGNRSMGASWDNATALEGETPTSALPDWATPGAQNAAASEDRLIGPGSWLNPDRLGKMIDPNSLVGKLLAMRNPSSAPAPVEQPQEQGLLAPLFAEGGLFGRDPTTPNSTTGGLW